MNKYLQTFAIVVAFSLHVAYSQTPVISVSPAPPYTEGQTFTATVTLSGCNLGSTQSFDIDWYCEGCTSTNVSGQMTGTCKFAPLVSGDFTFTVDNGAPDPFELDVTVTNQQVNGNPDCPVTNPCEGASQFLALPVDLAMFTAKKTDNNILLGWRTESEYNNEKFLIQRSQNGNNFETIGEVLGLGDSFESNVYSFVDTRPMNGLNYYRLKQMDFDGKFDYSPVELVRFGDRTILATLYPTITKGGLIVDLMEESIADISITDGHGRIILQRSYGLSQRIDLDVSDLPNGNYFMQIRTNTQVESKRFMKF